MLFLISPFTLFVLVIRRIPNPILFSVLILSYFFFFLQWSIIVVTWIVDVKCELWLVEFLKLLVELHALMPFSLYVYLHSFDISVVSISSMPPSFNKRIIKRTRIDFRFLIYYILLLLLLLFLSKSQHSTLVKVKL